MINVGDWITVVVVASYLNNSPRVSIGMIAIVSQLVGIVLYVVNALRSNNEPPPMVRSKW